jgi:hypothetical protein
MRKLVLAGILLTFCTLAAAQDTDPTPPPGGNWFSRLWSTGDPPAPKKTAPATKKSNAPAAVDVAATRPTRETINLDRRNEVILKLREIAQQTSDDALLQKADALQERAWDLYMQRTASTSGGIPEERR